MNSKAIFSLIQGLVIVIHLQFSISFGEAEEFCEQPVGRLVSIQGKAQIQRNGLPNWQVAVLNDNFCLGDTLRILTNGRAAVALRNETVLRIDQNSTIIFNKSDTEDPSILELLRGVLHIFSHRPRSFKVVTPYVNGVVEGTEFLVRVGTEFSTITVFEGKVAAVNKQGQLDLTSGQSAIAKQDKAPAYMTIVRPRDAVEWTLYYPVIIEPASTFSNDATVNSIHQAAANLFIGRVDEARVSLAQILKKDPDNSEALALSSVIETVRNNKDNALDLALRAVELSPGSASANLALSYAYQALFNIPAALNIIEQAIDFKPENGLLKARLAELLLAVGELDKAQAAASEAASLDPERGLSQTILGFAYLSRIEIDEALAAFNKAILLDSALPLARLGLGLAKIRMGLLEEGRGDIEIAAALNPDNSIIRSYLGKAYFEEKRDNHAERQYKIARQLDPADPTPWFYDAIREQTINRPVDALHDLQQSIERNDNRAVYRSSLLLDDDLASRSAGLGRIYTDLGFQQLARVEGFKSVQSNPSNYSAHRFLADTYINSPHHEIARVSELLQSQLLQPLNVTPVQPQLAESNLYILTGTGPSTPSFYEFNPLFLRNRIALQASGVMGSDNIFGDELILSGIENKFSYSLGQFHYQTDGIRENNDQEQDIYSGFFQWMLSPTTSIMAEFRSKEKDFGDLTFNFDPTNFSKTLRQSEESKSARIGIRHALQPHSTVIGTAIVSSDDGIAATGLDDFSMSVDFDVKADSKMVELQHIYQATSFNLQTGAGFLTTDESETITITSPFESVAEDNSETEHTNIYSYAQIELPYDFITTIGLSGDLLDSPTKDREEINPKFGLTWQPLSTTRVSAAVFKTVTRRSIYAQTIEPTLLSGFNQLFDDIEAAVSWNYGIGIDQTFSSDLHGGFQFYYRDLSIPISSISLTGTVEQGENDTDENLGSAYLYWTPLTWLSFGLEYYYEYYSYDKLREAENLTTHRLIPNIQFYHPCGLSAGIQASYIDQKGDFGSDFSGIEEDSDQFWVVDVSISYRLPKRFGIFTIGVKNLFDEQFKFLDMDPSNPRYLQELQVIGSLTVAF